MTHEIVANMGSQIDFHYVGMALVRGLWLLPFILMTGIVGFRLFVSNPLIASIGETGWEGTVRLKMRHFSRKWINISLLAFAAMCFIALLHETMMITGKGILNSVPYLLTVLEKTHWGRAWVDRMILLIVLGMFWGACLRKEDFPYRWFLVILSLIAATFSLIGHPADKGDYHWSIPLDALHLISISLWIGGLFPLFNLSRVIKPIYCPEMNHFLAAVVSRFSGLAMTSVGLVLATGLYSSWNAWGRIPSLAEALDSNYGNILLAKFVFFLGVLGCGGLSRFFVLPPLRSSRLRENSALIDRFFVFLLVELILAAFVLFLAFFLTQSSPPLSSSA